MQAKVFITPEAKQYLSDLRKLIRLPGYQSVQEEDVISPAIIEAYNKQLAKLNGANKGQQ